MSMEPIVALEIGTSRVRVFVAEAREDGGLVITAVGDSASSGMRKGEMVDFKSVCACVEAALRQAETAAQISINEVYLLMSGSQIESIPNRGEIPVDGEITAEDLEQVKEVAREVTLPAGREILHSILGQYGVDGCCGVSPVGMMGKVLSADMLILHGIGSRMVNVVKVVKEQKLDVLEILFTGLCAVKAALSTEQKIQGVLLIDLGGGTTDYVAYAQSRIADAGVIGVGGDHITNDIASAFRILGPEAEELKRQVGDAMVSAAGRTRQIPLPAGVGEEPRFVKLYDLQTIVHLRMEETFGLIRAHLQKQGLLNQIRGGVVLTGGGAYLKNVTQLAEKVFGLPCSVGAPRNVSGLSANLAVPEYATGVGGALYGYQCALNKAAQTPSLITKVGRWFGLD
jgi:cell division protein FtsA